jgi:hypothetical protein
VIHTDALIAFAKNERYNQTLFMESLNDIIRLVVKRHFPYGDEEEFYSVATLKCIALLRSEYVDLSPKRLVSFLYTGSRNEISNFVRSQKRLDSMSRLEQLEPTTLAKIEASQPIISNTEAPSIEIFFKKEHDRALQYFHRLGFDFTDDTKAFATTLSLDSCGRYYRIIVRASAWRAAHQE